MDVGNGKWIPDLRQLRSFMTVADEGSFTLAARQMNVTQSAVSHSVRSLEEQFGIRLLDRGNSVVTCTAAGKQLYTHCVNIFAELEAAVHEVGCGEEARCA